MNEELEQKIKEYLKDNLQITIRQKHDYYDGYYYEVQLILAGEVISESYT